MRTVKIRKERELGAYKSTGSVGAIVGGAVDDDGFGVCASEPGFAVYGLDHAAVGGEEAGVEGFGDCGPPVVGGIGAGKNCRAVEEGCEDGIHLWISV